MEYVGGKVHKLFCRKGAILLLYHVEIQSAFKNDPLSKKCL